VTVLMAVALAIGLVQGCGIVPLPCDISIAALGAEPSVLAGDPLPDDLAVIAGSGDFDADATSVIVDEQGSSIQLRLRGDAIVRLAAHTAAHTGKFLAIAINGTVVSVPMIMASIPDGDLQIVLTDADVPEVSEQLAGCIP
jgi:preprotein translocase subunit SecD